MLFRLLKPRQSPDTGGSAGGLTLADTPPGNEVILDSFGKMDADMSRSLQAYGLLPGRRLRVLAQQPVTMVQIEQTELAFERQVAREIHVRIERENRKSF